MPIVIDKKAVLAKLHHLPSLPFIVREVIASFNDANLDTASLASQIAQDQGLCAKTLRVANSSFYGLPRKVGSIEDAIIVLGFDTVRSLVLSAGVVQAFPPIPGSLFDRQAYWQRCFRIATLSKTLAKQFLRQGQQLAFTAGMFYDIGQLALDVCIPQKFSELLQQQAVLKLPLLDIEQSALGFDHAEFGAEMIRLWNFPPEIEQVVRYWQKPELQTAFDPLMCVVHIAALLESGASGEKLIAQLSETAGVRMQITWERIEACLPQSGRLDRLDSGVHLMLTT